jgi:hypothetical protein
METSPKLFADGMRSDAPPNYVPQVRENQRLAHAAHVDLTLMGMPRVNMLIVGAEDTTEVVLELLAKDLHQPMTHWHAGTRLSLPQTGRPGTLILHDVGSMARDDQQRLLEWMNGAAGRTQVISTAPEPMMPRLQSREFIDTLYYRLNTIYVDVTA